MLLPYANPQKGGYIPFNLFKVSYYRKEQCKNLSSFLATKKRLPRKVNALKIAYYDFIL
nr:MAG TPA: hypothetical protein [Caudoviricetes sp.]